MRNIPRKNYIILFVILGVTVALVFYARSWYLTSKNYYMQNSVVKEVVGEINYNELEGFVTENPKFIMYVSSGHDSDIKEFENSLKDLIVKLGLQDNVVYVNTDVLDNDSLSNILKNNYCFDSKIINQVSNKAMSSIYFFDNGGVSLVINNPDKYRISYIEKLLKDWKMKND